MKRVRMGSVVLGVSGPAANLSSTAAQLERRATL